MKLLRNLTISRFHATSKFVSSLEAMHVASFWIENSNCNLLQTFFSFAVVDIKLACWL